MKRAPSLQISRDGILRFSTYVILAGGTLTFTSCDSSERKAREARSSYENESRRLINELDAQRTQLLSGEVPNNFHIPGIGYYHATAHDFYEHSYNFQRDGKWFVNNAWVPAAGPESVPPSRPAPEVLRRIDEKLDKQQQSLDATAAQASNYQHHASSGPGMGTALMMYWLLSGNRGHYSPGAGFSAFGQRAPMWESNYRRQREDQARSSAYAGGGGSASRSSSYGSRSSTSPSGGDSSSTASRSSSSSSSASPSGTSSSGSSSRGGFGSSGGGSSSS